ncbi:hypothetical protein AV521_35235 [Streptomyces sp. IMTB 2501]|nr:hypothetical protein AV521_35235 [Streptomyces sp. IMTB 2501]
MSSLPHTRRRPLQGHIAALRTALSEFALTITTHPSGYQLAGGPETVDCHAFGALVHNAEAGARTYNEPAAARLRRALDLWRGPALGGLPTPPTGLARRPARRVPPPRRRPPGRADVAGLRSPADGVIGELTGYARRHPPRERLHAPLTPVLPRTAGQAKTLTVYADGPHRLSDELGMPPGPAISELHPRILRADARPGGGDQVRHTARRAPSQLPADVMHYDVGRRREIARLIPASPRTPRPARWSPMTGMGGPGKSAFAVRAKAPPGHSGGASSSYSGREHGALATGRGRYRDSSWWDSSRSKPVTLLPSRRSEAATGA